MVSLVRLGPRKLLKVTILTSVFLFIIVYLREPAVFNRSPHVITGTELATDGSSQRGVAGEFCKGYGWKPFRTKSRGGRRKVYDLIMINTELDWLGIRLATLWDHVDYFVIVESSKTFTGLDKPLTIKEHWTNFTKFHEKLIYHQLAYPKDFDPQRHWDREDLQRNAMYEQVFPGLEGAQEPAEDDVIIVADVDEIPRPETILVLRNCIFPRRLTLRSQFYYYSFQWLHRGQEWAHPQATYYQGSNTILPVNLRNGDGGFKPLVDLDKADLWNAAWHCSSCFATLDEFLTKLSSFSHAWMNDPLYRDKARIVERVRAGKDVWDREGEIYDRVENNTDVPRYLLDYPEKFGYLLDRDGSNAGFTDYP